MPQLVTLKWNSKIKRHYVELGYHFTAMGEEFNVSVSDLTRASVARVIIICDYCNEEYDTKYNNYIVIKEKETIHKDSCKKCKDIKLVESNLNKYGVTSTTKLKKVRAKQIETLYENYGVVNPMESAKIRAKLKEANILKYGEEFTINNSEIRKKTIETNIQKYGVKYPFQSEEIMNKVKLTHLKKYGSNPIKNIKVKEKAELTNLIKYGVKNVFSLKEFQDKAKLSLYNNGTAPCSKQQAHIHNVVGGELNYPLLRYSLDISFVEEKIYIEYNGGGHDLQVKLGIITEKDFLVKEIIRNRLIKKEGWKRIEIISKKDLLPDDEILNNIMIKSKIIFNSGRSWIAFDIDEDQYRFKDNCIKYEFGKLRKII